jgi:hypothetical protein
MRLLEKCGRYMDNIDSSLRTIHNHREALRIHHAVLSSYVRGSAKNILESKRLIRKK